MSKAQQKTVQYLNEAYGMERGLVRVLQSQIAMTPSGSYRSALEAHLKETRTHAERVRGRLKELDEDGNPLGFGIGLVESVVGQALALSKAPLDMVRGSSREEKLLKNAKDSYAAEALEIATYSAIERLARSLGDAETADLAASIRSEEEKMCGRLAAQIPMLTDAVIDAEVHGASSYELSETGAAEAVRDAGDAAKRAASETRAAVKRTARTARKVPGVARAEGELKGMVASEEDLAISGYGKLTAAEIAERLPDLSQMDLAKIDAYERKTENRTTVLSKIAALRDREPWPGYDELDVGEIASVLREGDPDRAKRVRTYERVHKGRTGVLDAAASGRR